jgi:hypothetical protein
MHIRRIKDNSAMIRAKGIMEIKREELRETFRQLTPLERIRIMNTVFNDMIALKAKTSGVPEYEIYRRYLDSREQSFL